MEPVIIEVSCNLSNENPLWKEIDVISLEVGYPGRNGRTLWKQIGWLRDQVVPFGKTFAHALWNQRKNEHIMVFDFLPVIEPKKQETERAYFIKKCITTPDGRTRTSKSRLVRGDFSDDHFSLKADYPKVK